MFTPNLMKYHETKDIGACPKCNEKLNISIFDTPIRTNYEIRCEKCNKAQYFTGVTKKND